MTRRKGNKEMKTISFVSCARRKGALVFLHVLGVRNNVKVEVSRTQVGKQLDGQRITMTLPYPPTKGNLPPGHL
jgi:hypothetical protein